MPVVKDRGYLAPEPFTTRGSPAYRLDELLDWSKSAISDGRSYLRLQPAYDYIQPGLDILNGTTLATKNKSLSDVKLEMTARNIKELVASQTNIRIIPAFKSDIPEFRQQNQILNKCFMAWQGMTYSDRRIRKAWQYAAACGTGYVGIRYEPNYWYPGKGDIVLDSYGPLDVTPIGMGRQHDLQRAYCVTLKVQTPLHEAWRLFPDHIDKINPSRMRVEGRGTVAAKAVKYGSYVLQKFGVRGSSRVDEEYERATWEMVDIYYHYIDDDSINVTGKPMHMGDVGTSWEYTVPYLGQEIKVGERDGEPIIRKASRKDSLLFPNRRLIIATDEAILTPDPSSQSSPYWHAKVPLVQFRADDWPWMFLGMPLTRMGASLERANTELMRGCIDSANLRLDPPRGYDQGMASKSLMEITSTRVPGTTVPMDYTFGGGDPIKPFLPINWYEWPSQYLELIQQNEQRITHQMGVADVQALARARQLPSGDSQDKIMESLGPLVKDQSRNMEESIRGIGELWKSCFFQFITASRRMELMGPDGTAEEDFDFDPGTLIPASETVIQMRKMGVGELSYFERARWHKDNFSFTVHPYSLHELNSITRRLQILQLVKLGFPLSWWTMADLFDFKNFGELPKFEDPETGQERYAQTELEKWICQMEITARMKAAEGGGQPGPQKGKGRPGTMAQPATLEQKSAGDSTIRSSKK